MKRGIMRKRHAKATTNPLSAARRQSMIRDYPNGEKARSPRNPVAACGSFTNRRSIGVVVGNARPKAGAPGCRPRDGNRMFGGGVPRLRPGLDVPLAWSRRRTGFAGGCCGAPLCIRLVLLHLRGSPRPRWIVSEYAPACHIAVTKGAACRGRAASPRAATRARRISTDAPELCGRPSGSALRSIRPSCILSYCRNMSGCRYIPSWRRRREFYR